MGICYTNWVSVQANLFSIPSWIQPFTDTPTKLHRLLDVLVSKASKRAASVFVRCKDASEKMPLV